jgi:NUMOD3 motif
MDFIIMNTIPYTYLLKHIPSNNVYYGVRFAKNCSPNDLFVTYFTSSKEVKQLIKTDGVDSFIFEIRRTFTDIDKARLWESKVLKRMDVIHNPKFINKSNNISIRKNNNWWLGKKRGPKTQEHIDKCVATYKARGRGLGNKHTAGRPLSENHKAAISQTTKGRPKSEETKLRMSQSMKGKSKSEEHRRNLSLANIGRVSPRKGAITPESTKLKISETKKKVKTYKQFLTFLVNIQIYLI